MQITCRFCEQRDRAQPDGVLLCSSCRLLGPAGLLRSLLRLEAGAEQAMDARLAEVPGDSLISVANYLHSHCCVLLGTTRAAAHERRTAATIAAGGPVAGYVAAHRYWLHTRKWGKHAAREIEALADAGTGAGQ